MTNYRPGKDYALFFAVDDYRDNNKYNNLRNPIKDAKALAKELKEMYGFETYIYENPSQEKVIRILESWMRKTFAEDAQLFIFFSGHGTFRDLTKKGYFIPYAAQAGDYGDYLELTDIGNIITQIPCSHILLAVDACYSGTIDQAIAFKGERAFRRPNENEDSDRDKILQRQWRNQSRLLITSGGKERTPDGKDHSPFAGAILKGLKGAYSYGDGLFIFTDLLSQLERVSPRPHRGELIGHDAGGFVFVAKGNSLPDSSNNKRTDQHLTNSRLGSMAETSAKQSISSFTDRDGNTYAFKTMKDGKRWMAQNLNIKIKDSYCYDDKDENCQKFGRLYTFEAAKEGCRLLGDGWRLATDDEWRKLANEYGGIRSREGGAYKEFGDPTTSFQQLSRDGSSGFAALLGGIRYSGGSYYNLGTSTATTGRVRRAVVDDAW